MSMQIFWSFLVTLGLSACFVPLVNKAGRHLGIIAEQNKRTIHKGKIARIGGMAIYLSFLIGAAIFLKADRQINAILIGSFLIFTVGFLDDIFDLSPKKKLLVELVAALVIILCGDIWIKGVSIPFLPSFSFEYISMFVTIAWIIGITNAINLIDGLDGLCAGVSTIVLIAIAMTSLVFSRTDIAAISVLLAGAICGFLCYNFHPASIFMGDCGALFIGFMISVISLLGFGYKSSAFFTLGAPIVMLAVPIMDTFLAIIRRRLRGQKFSDADREHLHHTLMFKLDLGQTRSVIILYVATTLFALSAYVYVFDKKLGLLIFLGLILIFELFIEYTGMVNTHYKPILATLNLFLKNPNLPSFSAQQRKVEIRAALKKDPESFKDANLEIEKEKLKMKKRKQKNLIVALALIAVAVIGGIAVFFATQRQSQEAPIALEEDTVNYVEGNHPTALMDEIYDQLLAANESGDKTQERELVAAYFATDFLTWSNKTDREDIGGLYLVYPDIRTEFASYALNLYYVNMNEHALTYGQEGLPEVESYAIISDETSDFIYEAKNLDSTYDITVQVTYKSKEGGMPTEDLKQEAVITVLEDGEKFYVVGVDYTNINAKTDTN